MKTTSKGPCELPYGNKGVLCMRPKGHKGAHQHLNKEGRVRASWNDMGMMEFARWCRSKHPITGQRCRLDEGHICDHTAYYQPKVSGAAQVELKWPKGAPLAGRPMAVAMAQIRPDERCGSTYRKSDGTKVRCCFGKGHAYAWHEDDAAEGVLGMTWQTKDEYRPMELVKPRARSRAAMLVS